MSFPCTKCGLCCRNLNDAYSDLNRGDGICMYLDTENELCSIYNKRPLKCRIDDSYKQVYYNTIDKESYYQLNAKACNNMQSKFNIDEKFKVIIK